MTDFVIQKQIQDIRKAADNATKSRETARQFLSSAGIIMPANNEKKSKSTKKS